MGPSYKKHDISEFMGKRFGHLTVTGKAEADCAYSNTFIFRCDCGAIIQEQPARVISGHKSSCGKCEYSNLNKSPRVNIDDYIGKKSGKLTVVGLADKKPTEHNWRLRCLCECGNYIDVLPYHFRKGIVKTCGCSKRIGTRLEDGRSLHPLYGIWSQMMRRCYNQKSRHYSRYGGRGISVCEEWHDFWNFAKWSDSVGGRPKGYEIDRIDNDGNYCPENCRWATRRQQNLNKSSNIFIEYNGRRQTLFEWSIETGISWAALNHRYHRGWSIERMLTTPMQKRENAGAKIRNQT